MQKRKILFCTSSYKTGRGGVASYAHDVIAAFADDYEFVVVTGDHFLDDGGGIVVRHIGCVDLSSKAAERLLAVISEEAPDIIVNSGHPLMTLVTPFVPDATRVISVSHFVNGRLSWVAGVCSRWADGLVALSSFGKEYLDKKFNVAKGKARVIFNYIDPITNVNPDAKKQAPVLRIVYPGGTSFQKSAEVVCGMLRRLQRTEFNFEFFWLGSTRLPGADWPLVRLHDVSDCIDMNDKRIKHVGLVDRARAQEILAGCNIFLLPSRGEGFPISLLEAMRSSCIAVVSDARHGSLDIIRNGVNGIVVKQGSVDGLLKAVTDILHSHSDYFHIYDNCLRTFNDIVAKDKWIGKMEELFSAPPMHDPRLRFSPKAYAKGQKYLKAILFFDWLRDRFFRQPYFMVYFRYLKLFR